MSGDFFCFSRRELVSWSDIHVSSAVTYRIYMVGTPLDKPDKPSRTFQGLFKTSHGFQGLKFMQ